MRISVELGGEAERSVRWKGWLLSLFVSTLVVCAVIAVVGAIRGDTAMVENSGVLAFLLLLVAAPAWVGYSVGRHEAAEHKLSEQMSELQEGVVGMQTVVEHLETVMSGSSVTRFPPQPRRNTDH